MYQIDLPSAANALPAPAALGAVGYFQDEDAGLGVEGTIVPADYMNMLMLELLNLLAAASIAPSKTTYNQVLAAINFLIDAAIASVASSVQGSRKKLKIVNDGGTPNTVMDVTADELVLEDGGGDTWKLSGVNLTVNSALAGAGGLDTGALAASTAYHIWVIAEPGGASPACIMSLSATAPTMPGGYTLKARVGGTAITDSAKHFLRLTQLGEDVQFAVTPATNTANMVQLASGTSGSVSVPTYTAVSLAGLVPATARRARFAIYGGGLTADFTLLAPNPNYGPGLGSGTPSGSTNVPYFQWGSQNLFAIGQCEMLLESLNAYYASSNADAALWLAGFTESL